MRTQWVVAMLLVMGSGGGLVWAEVGGVPPLRLVWLDRGARVEPVREQTFLELERILRETGLGAVWTIWDGSAREAHESEISIDIEDVPPAYLPRRTMAATRPATRHIWVFMRNVREAVGLAPQPREPLSGRGAERLSRALARVLVHELAHAGAPDEPHATSGVRAPRLGGVVLSGPLLVLDGVTRRALRAAAIVHEDETTVAAR